MSRCPFSVNRRGMLLGLGVAGTSLAAPLLAKATETNHNVTDAPAEKVDQKAAVPFYGTHQAGVVTARPACGMVAAFDLVVQNPADLQQMFQKLTERIRWLTQGGIVPERDPKLPPLDSGILGAEIEPDNLTITVSVGASLFDNMPWLAHLKPRQLQQMQEFPNDALVEDRCHGDLVLQFCANTQPTTAHALRDIVKNMSDFMVLRWRQEGSVPAVSPDRQGRTPSARNFLGFRDGSANPDASDAQLMSKLVWIDEQADEPSWARHGSYQVIRLIRMFVEQWDRTPLGEQEAIFGRRKMSGAPMGGGVEFDEPDFSKDADGALTPLTAHIRLANPRTPETQKNLILRRPFNISNGVSNNGQMEDGLMFIAYQASLKDGFIAVQERLNGEPLEEYIKPFGGGYFFVLPGIRGPQDYVGCPLIEAIA